MSEPADPSRRPSGWRPLGCEAAVPLAYLLGSTFFSAYIGRFQNDGDEGINLMKAFLLARGEPLYASVWSDQPPLFTWLLRGLWMMTGESVESARLLVLLFATLLLWACARFARLVWGRVAALAAPLAVIFAPDFQRLSVSVMIGLPAIAIGTLALVQAAEWQRSRSPWRAAGSGALLGLSMMTKLFTGVLAPVLVAGFFLGSPRRAALRAAATWLAAFTCTFLLLGVVLVGSEGVEQLVRPHVTAWADASWKSEVAFPFAEPRLQLVGVLALAGAVLSIRDRRPAAAAAALWALLAFAVLVRHRPLWFHHLLLPSVPLALLASAAVEKLAGRLALLFPAPARLRALAATAGVAIAFVLVAWDGFWFRPALRRGGSAEREMLVRLIERLRRPEDTMVTDVPMVAFRAGLPVPPETTVLSEKRIRTGLAGEGMVHRAVDRTEPAFVLLGRFSFPELRRELRSRRPLAWSRDGDELFVRPRPGSCRWPACAEMPEAWYASAEAEAILRNVLAAQHEDGGWAKNQERTFDAYPEDVACSARSLEGCSTIDNGATTAELRFLGRSVPARSGGEVKRGFDRGIDFLLRSQLPAGGWAQVPDAPRTTYQAAITLNDDAMTRVLELLRDVARDPRFAFVDETRRRAAEEAFSRGIDMLLRVQVVAHGRRTVWAAQYHPVTLRPAGARSFEPAALSGRESVGVVRLLMSVPEPSPRLTGAVMDAVRWFERARLPDGRWARFYDLETGRPIFPDRDGTLATRFDSLSPERRSGYDYFTDAPGPLLEPAARGSAFRSHEPGKSPNPHT